MKTRSMWIAAMLLSLPCIAAATNQGITLEAFAEDMSAESIDSGGDISGASGSNRFIVWTDDTPGNNDIFFRRSTDNGASWGTKLNLSNTGNAEIGSMVISGSKAYVFWTDYLTDDIFLKRSLDSGASWGSAKNVVGGSAGVYPSDAAAVGSDVFLVYIRVTTSNEEVFIKRSVDSGASWESAKNLSNNSGESNRARIGV